MNDLARSPPPGASQLLNRQHISSRDKWAGTGVTLEQGRRYFFRASGTWRDAWIHCDANGYNRTFLNLAKRFLRCSTGDACWFMLIGAIGESTDSFFVIGDGARWSEGWIAPASGKLSAFANDINGFYWNNSRSIILEVWQ
ncbi:hypothetical protein [Pseudomonas sp. NPDC096950]|uniref:hypothetical protein n=1 Tax=Pseudomonas sp. NPDC096950 TaxID=3364485 RepID=UPI00383BB48C